MRFLAALFFMMLATAFALAQSAATPATAPVAADPCAETNAQLTRLENRLKDWPALGRYHDANAKVAAAAKHEQRVVFMGDSITDS